MAKKERLGSDPLKDSLLGWIQDTRKKTAKEEPEKDKDNDVLTSKRYSVKTSKRENVKDPKRLNAKMSVKKRHTVYLTAAQSKKLRVYSAANEISISEVIEKLIKENI